MNATQNDIDDPQRHIIGYIGNLSHRFDHVDVPLLDHCVDGSLDYHSQDSSMGLLLRPSQKCHRKRFWVLPLVVVGEYTYLHILLALYLMS